MNKNRISVTVKSQSGNTWPDAEFNIHQKLRLLLEKAMSEFHLDGGRTYEVILERTGQSLPLDAAFDEAGVRDGDVLLVRTVGRTVDGSADRA